MRQGAVLLSFSLIGAIVGCGGAGSYTKSLDSSTSANVSSVGSAGANGPSANAGTSGTSSASGSSSSSGSSAGGGSSNGGSGSTAGSTTSNPPATPAPTPTSTTQVVINSPTEGATVSSPTQVSAAATGGASITSMQVYVDDGVAFQADSAQINASLNLPTGPHTILAQAWDQNGNAFKSTPLHVLVQAPAASPAPAPAPAPAPSAPAPTIGQIQTQGGWDDCDVCAGDAGNGPHTAHGMERGISSPSLSGASTRFDIGGTAWGAALFWLELGSHDDAQNLRYDLDFYIDSTASAQALEFDVNQTANGNKYIFGTECDFRNTGTWRVWNGPAHTWASTGVGCPMPDTGTWHHLTWEFQRSGGQAHFIAVTLDGNRRDVGMAFDGLGQSGSGLDVAFQADLNASGGNVSVWLDNVSLSW